MSTLQNHILYMRPTYPYCLRVLGFMESQSIEMELRDITDPAHARTLVEVGGKQQVPCLVIDGKPLYESADIISYLERETA